jgi:hypothetical protein
MVKLVLGFFFCYFKDIVSSPCVPNDSRQKLRVFLLCFVRFTLSSVFSGVEGYPRSYRNLSENVKIEQTNKTQSRLRYQISKGDIAIITRATNLQLIIENELSSEATSSNQGFLTIF